MIYILGGSGFIGTRLASLLARADVDFKIIDKTISTTYPKLTVIADVRAVDSLQAAIQDDAVIINLAAEHRDDVRPLSLYDEVNVGGARNVCTVAREKNIRTIIFTSTVAVYGFAPVGTDESGQINPFNDYGRTKFEAEQVYKAWQAEASETRSLVIIRPTVVFGEQNRGNVYNLLRQIASGRFVMVGDGHNKKSMAYVENIADCLQYAMGFGPGVHVYNYIDKPDCNMKDLVQTVYRILGRSDKDGLHLPVVLGLAIGGCFDILACMTGRKFSISAIRVKKFCADTVFETSIARTGFVPPVLLSEALDRTVRHEFVESHTGDGVFYTE